ncbi:MAG: response regulator transcription factor [Pseudomonadota bacterium]
MATRVFLIDDHPVVEAGLTLGFSITGRFQLVGSARTHGAALEAIEAANPDLIVSDLVIDGEIDWSSLKLCRAHAPDAALIVFSSLDPDLYRARALSEGADGFISKSVSPHDMEREILAVLSGSAPPASQSVAKAEGALPIQDGLRLTKREMEVARLLAKGCTVADVAQTLKISKKTAAIHRDNLKSKLSCSTSTALTALLAGLRPQLERGSP